MARIKVAKKGGFSEMKNLASWQLMPFY